VKDLLRSDDLSRTDIERVLATAARFAADPLAERQALAGRSVVIHMTKPSTRTRLASETAVAHLGGTPIFVRGDELQLGRGETIADTARVISGFASAFIIRTFAQADVDEMAANASIPVINALTDEDHPTQALADWLTITEHFGSIESGALAGRKFTYFGDGNNMAHSWLLMGAVLGAHVVVSCPAGAWEPDPAIIERARRHAALSGGVVEIEHDPTAAAKDASVLYTDVWMSMGDPEEERTRKVAELGPYAVTSDLMSAARPDGIFMHCLPAHRGEEVSAEVIDGERSLIWRQAFHRRTTIQAVLLHLIAGDLTGH
jgi:ornithine carbamoyltransferase